MSDSLHLRSKFIAVAMISVSIVIAVLMTILNASSFIRLARQADQMLQVLASNQGSFPAPIEKPSRNEPPMSPEAPFETRFFSVTFKDDSTVSADTAFITAVNQQKALDFALKVKEEGKERGFIDNYRFLDSGAMVVFLDCTRDLKTARSLLATSALVAAAGLLCVFLLSLVLSRIAIKPIEMADLRQRRFVTDASHEIRTPLTIIDANTEVLEMTYGQSEWTRSTRSQVARLAKLTSSLVELARLDEREKLEKAPFSLSDALKDCISDFQALAMTRSRELRLDIQDSVVCNADEAMIRQLICLLLDNAVKYSSQSIDISLAKSGKKARLSISNSVESIKAGPHPELFDRFVRMDQARSSSQKGYGLGLAMAWSIAQASGAKISAFSPDEHSFTVLVVF